MEKLKDVLGWIATGIVAVTVVSFVVWVLLSISGKAWEMIGFSVLVTCILLFLLWGLGRTLKNLKW